MRIVAMIASAFIISVLSIFSLIYKSDIRFVPSARVIKMVTKYLLFFGAPLILHQFSLFFRGQFDKIFIYNLFTAKELGVYSAGYQLASVFNVVILALNKAAVPYFYELIKNKKINSDYLLVKVLYSIPLSFIPVLIGFFIPEALYQYILGEGFIGSKIYVVLFLLGFSMSVPYLILVNYMFYYGLNKQISYCTIFSSTIYVLSVFILSNFGVEYVPLSLFISNFISSLVLYFYIKIVPLSRL